MKKVKRKTLYQSEWWDRKCSKYHKKSTDVFIVIAKDGNKILLKEFYEWFDFDRFEFVPNKRLVVR